MLRAAALGLLVALAIGSLAQSQPRRGDVWVGGIMCARIGSCTECSATGPDGRDILVHQSGSCGVGGGGGGQFQRDYQARLGGPGMGGGSGGGQSPGQAAGCGDGRAAYVDTSGRAGWCEGPGAGSSPSGGFFSQRSVQRGAGIIATALPLALDQVRMAQATNESMETQLNIIANQVRRRTETRRQALAHERSVAASARDERRTQLAASLASIASVQTRVSAYAQAQTDELGPAPDSDGIASLRSSVVRSLLPPLSPSVTERLRSPLEVRPRGPAFSEAVLDARQQLYANTTEAVVAIDREQARLQASEASPELRQHAVEALDLARQYRASNELASALLTEARSIRAFAEGKSPSFVVAERQQGGAVSFESARAPLTTIEPENLRGQLRTLNADLAGLEISADRFPHRYAEAWPDQPPTLGEKLALKLRDWTGVARDQALLGDIDGAREIVDFCNSALDFSLSLLPYGRDAYEALTGRDAYTGEELDEVSHRLAMIGALVPWGSKIGKAGLAIKKITRGLGDRLVRAIDGAIAKAGEVIERAGFPPATPANIRDLKDHLQLDTFRESLGLSEAQLGVLEGRLRANGRDPANGNFLNVVVSDPDQQRHLVPTPNGRESIWEGPDPQTFILENFDRGTRWQNTAGRYSSVPVTDYIGRWKEEVYDQTGTTVIGVVDRGPANWARIKFTNDGAWVFPDGPPPR